VLQTLPKTSYYIYIYFFQIVRANVVQVTVFCIVTTCRIVSSFRRFGGIDCFHLQSHNMVQVDTEEIRRRKFVDFIRGLKGFFHILYFVWTINKYTLVRTTERLTSNLCERPRLCFSAQPCADT
jgi:hypothetical protein